MIRHRTWANAAVATLDAEFNRSADTHLIRVDLPGFPGIPLYLKDESVHPTGSLKHRLARSLFLYAICNGWLREGMPVIEASSGSTAISEAYFARLLKVPFIAVVPASTSPGKIAEIEHLDGRCELVGAGEAGNIYAASERLAAELGGHYMDQFTYAERATDWRGNNNIAASIFEQMEAEPDPIPRWIVMSAGTGGTSATIGRYIRFAADRCVTSQLCVVDPEGSVFYDYYASGDNSLTSARPSRIEGIGRPRVEPSFVAGVVDRMMKVPDAASIACLKVIQRYLGRRCGPSTGTNLVGALRLMSEMRAAGETGPVVTLICDGGERYECSYYDPPWVKEHGLDDPGDAWLDLLAQCARTGEWPGDAFAQLESIDATQRRRPAGG